MHRDLDNIEGQNAGGQTINEVKTFPVPFSIEESKDNITITTHKKPSIEQIINQAFKFRSQGNLSEAAKYYQFFIDQGFKDYRVFLDYGKILKDFSHFDKSKDLLEQSIRLKPDLALAYLYIGEILLIKEDIENAKIYFLKSLKIDPTLSLSCANLGSIFKLKGKIEESDYWNSRAIKMATRAELQII